MKEKTFKTKLASISISLRLPIIIQRFVAPQNFIFAHKGAIRPPLRTTGLDEAFPHWIGRLGHTGTMHIYRRCTGTFLYC